MTKENTIIKRMAKINCPVLNILEIRISYSVKEKVESIEFTHLTEPIVDRGFLVVNVFYNFTQS
jgi:hypothetical protein